MNRMPVTIVRPFQSAVLGAPGRVLGRMAGIGRRRLPVFATACGLVLLTACAVSPETRESLEAYTLAMQDVQLSADQFLSDVSKAVEVRKELERTANADAPAEQLVFPAEFVLPGDPDESKSEAEKKIKASRSALEAIRLYNDALVALAEGRSEAEIKAQVTQFGDALTTLGSIAGVAVPGFGAFVDIGSKLVKLAQDARNAQELKRAVTKGHPHVHTILTTLEKQTPAIYKASHVVAQKSLDVPRKEIRIVASRLKLFMARHSQPTDTAVATDLELSKRELLAIGSQTDTLEAIKAIPVPFPFASQKPAFDQNAMKEMSVFLGAAKAGAEKFAEVAAKQNAYYEALEKYVAALRQIGASLDRLKESLERPVDLRAEAQRLLGVAFELRGAVAEFRNPPASAPTPTP